MFSIAQITDLHVGQIIETKYGPLDPLDQVKNTVLHINNMHIRPDIVMVTGDLVENGNFRDYIKIKNELEKLTMDYYIIPGNHDDRNTLRSVFSTHRYFSDDTEFLHYSIDIEKSELRIIGLDTVNPGQYSGLLCSERLQWIQDQLNEKPDSPTVIFMHHPPFKSGIKFADQVICENGDKFAEIVAQNPQIEAIACGHFHCDVSVRWHGTVAYITPSASFSYDHKGVDERGIESLKFLINPPCFRTFSWVEGTGLVSEINFVGDFGCESNYIAKPKEAMFGN